MKFSAELLKDFDLSPQDEKEPVNVMKISEMLDFLKQTAERIHNKSQLFQSTSDANIQLDCMDIVTTKLNDFVQVFRDISIFMRIQEGTHKDITSLRYCITSYDTFPFNQTENEKLFLQELLLRNEITHDYFNRELHQQKLVWLMQNCSDGALDVYYNLQNYCAEHQLLELYANKTR